MPKSLNLCKMHKNKWQIHDQHNKFFIIDNMIGFEVLAREALYKQQMENIFIYYHKGGLMVFEDGLGFYSNMIGGVEHSYGPLNKALL